MNGAQLGPGGAVSTWAQPPVSSAPPSTAAPRAAAPSAATLRTLPRSLPMLFPAARAQPRRRETFDGRGGILRPAPSGVKRGLISVTAPLKSSLTPKRLGPMSRLANPIDGVAAAMEIFTVTQERRSN